MKNNTNQQKQQLGTSQTQTSSEPLFEDSCFCCCCCFLSIADLCTARMLGLDFQNCKQIMQTQVQV